MDIMAFLVFILLGALVGWLASLVTKRDAEQGWIGNILVGVGGSLIAGWIVGNGALVLNVPSLFWAFLGAVLVCIVINLITRKQIR